MLFIWKILQEKGHLPPFWHSLQLWSPCKPYEMWAEWYFKEGCDHYTQIHSYYSTDGHRGLSHSLPLFLALLTQTLWGQRVEALAPTPQTLGKPGKASESIPSFPILIHGKRRTWWAWCHIFPHTGHERSPPTAPPRPATVQILDSTPRLAKRKAGMEERARMGLIFACSCIVSRGKKWQHRVQFAPPSEQLGPSERGQADRWLPTSVLCGRYRWGTPHHHLSSSICL